MEKVKGIFGTAVAWAKEHVKLLIAIVVAIVVVILAVSLLSGGPKKAVKNYIKGMNKMNAAKVMKTIDTRGMLAWNNCGGKESKFEEAYEDLDDDEVDEYTEKRTDSLEDLMDGYKDLDKFSMKLEEIKEVKKSDKVKGMYKVKAKVKTEIVDDDDEDSDTNTMTFIVYKNKIVGMEY